jgi:hypothetical protein
MGLESKKWLDKRASHKAGRQMRKKKEKKWNHKAQAQKAVGKNY